MDAPFSLQMERIGKLPILYPSGDMTAETDDQVWTRFRELQAEGPRMLIVNFSRTGYINSGGMGTMLAIALESAKAGPPVRFVGLSTHFRKIAEMIGVFGYVSHYETNREALDTPADAPGER
jgi:anti-anti-sigma factor